MKGQIDFAFPPKFERNSINILGTFKNRFVIFQLLFLFLNKFIKILHIILTNMSELFRIHL